MLQSDAVAPAALSPQPQSSLSLSRVLCGLSFGAAASLVAAIAIPVILDNVGMNSLFFTSSSARPEWLSAALDEERRGRDISLGEVTVSAATAWKAGAVSLRYRRRATCSVCSGAGGLGRVPCSDCGGSGARLARTMFGVQRLACSSCGGAGVRHARVCSTCGGSGAIAEDSSTLVFISPGLRDGDEVRVLGAGDFARGDVTSGMLGVRLRDDFRDFPQLTRCTPSLPACLAHESSGDRLAGHLHARVEVSLREAMLGFERVLQHPGGTVSVRASSVTQPGQTIVLVGHGLPLRVPFFDARTLRNDAGARVEVQSEFELARDGDALAIASAAAAGSPSALICALLPAILRPFMQPLLGISSACSSGGPAYGDLLITVDVRIPQDLSLEHRNKFLDAFAAS